jgi:hypothetical protein
MKRPIGVTILAILAGVLAVIAGVRTLQFLGLLPFFFGPIPFRSFSLFAAIMWGLMVWVYVWLVKMLWDVRPEAWMFLAVISVFNMILEFVTLVGGAVWQDVALTFLVNGLILIYVMLPGTKKAFGMK